MSPQADALMPSAPPLTIATTGFFMRTMASRIWSVSRHPAKTFFGSLMTLRRAQDWCPVGSGKFGDVSAVARWTCLGDCSLSQAILSTRFARAVAEL